MWFARYLTTRRKFKRLVGEIKNLRSRAEALEKENERLRRKWELDNYERLERELRLVDRILVSKDVFAITDEVRATVEGRDETDGKRHKEELQIYLQRQKELLYEDALVAGEPLSAADNLYSINEQTYIDLFEQSNK